VMAAHFDHVREIPAVEAREVDEPPA